MNQLVDMPAVTPRYGPPLPSAPLRLLLVDGNADFLLAERAYFGMDERVRIVGQASTSDHALARFAELAPDLVLIDLFVPHAGGLDVAARMRRAGGAVAILLTALREGPEYARAAWRAGADGFIAKANFCADIEAVLHGLRPAVPAPAGGARG